MFQIQGYLEVPLRDKSVWHLAHASLFKNAGSKMMEDDAPAPNYGKD
jgi:hypothetical protein